MKANEKSIGESDRLPCLTLKRRPADREKAKHPWIFSNEIQEIPARVKHLGAGALVEVLDCHGAYLGTGLWNPSSLIAVRLLSDRRGEEIDENFFARKLRFAIELRERFLGDRTEARGTYRAVFGESDGLPGLVIDRFQSTWVMQIHSLGMWSRVEEIEAGLKRAVEDLGLKGGVAALYVRTDVQSRKLEGLPEVQELRSGAAPKAGVFAHEAGIEFVVDPLAGQKTGFYFDQRQNRTFWRELIAAESKAREDLRVADLYSNSGAWGLAALKAGAQSAVFVDSSESALDSARAAAERAGLIDSCEFILGDVSDVMAKLPAKTFDYVSLDPPSFIPNKKSVPAGLKGYSTINHGVARILRPGGILASSSCSHHCQSERFEDVVTQALRKANRDPALIMRGGPALDHPERPGMPESRYLKCLFYRV